MFSTDRAPQTLSKLMAGLTPKESFGRGTRMPGLSLAGVKASSPDGTLGLATKLPDSRDPNQQQGRTRVKDCMSHSYRASV